MKDRHSWWLLGCFLGVAMWLVGCSNGCNVVARVFWPVVRGLLRCSGWLPGCCKMVDFSIQHNYVYKTVSVFGVSLIQALINQTQKKWMILCSCYAIARVFWVLSRLVIAMWFVFWVVARLCLCGFMCVFLCVFLCVCA